jgi:hypothetical protein
LIEVVGWCSHLAVFVMHRDGHARLDFIQVCAALVATPQRIRLIASAFPRLLSQNLEYKFVELLSVNFSRSSDEAVRQSITFRYNSVKSRLAVMQTRLQVRFGLAVHRGNRSFVRSCGTRIHTSVCTLANTRAHTLRVPRP